MPFPDDESLCETCGYSLRGMRAEQVCPECGAAVAASDPVNRPGLPWQRGMGLRSWLVTTRRMVFAPSGAFRELTLAGGNGRDRVYLASFVVLAGLLWAVLWWVARLGLPVTWACWAMAGVLAMTYVEAAGVTYFSRRRGWRVPWRLAERVACCAAVGWLPATLLCAKAMMLVVTGDLAQGWRKIAGPGWIDPEPMVPVLAFGVGILWFETLVWLGVRKVRFANRVSVD